MKVSEGRKPQTYRGNREMAGKKISEKLLNSTKVKAAAAAVIATKAKEYTDFLLEHKPHIQHTGEYLGAIVKTAHHCTKHGQDFDARPNDIKGSKPGCAQCSVEKRSASSAKAASNPEMWAKIKATRAAKYDTEAKRAALQEKTAQARIQGSIAHLDDSHKAMIQDKQWWINNYSEGSMTVGCIMRMFSITRDIAMGWRKRLGVEVKRHRVSEAEMHIINYIKGKGFEVLSQNRELIPPKEIDIYVPALKLGIEYNGNYWHSNDPLEPLNRAHECKVRACEAAGIKLIQIWEADFETNPDKVFRFIDNALGLVPRKVGARACTVRTVNHVAYSVFLDTHHMQGSHNAVSHRLGLYHGEELVAVMGFTKMASNIKKYGPGVGFELSRFASVGVSGAFSKLLTHFRRAVPCDFIYSFADLEIVSRLRNVYLSAGFVEHHTVAVDYTYYDRKESARKHKFGYRKAAFKSMGMDIEGKTEAQLASEVGLRRCWDSGKVAYILRCAK